MLALFGITYRYAVRTDPNPNLKQGVVGAFAITKALSSITVPDYCSSIPLNCGPPLYFVSPSMVFSGLLTFVLAMIAYGGAAYFIEQLFLSGILRKFPK